MQATFEARVKDLGVYPALDAVAELCGRLERALFVDRYLRHRRPPELDLPRFCGQFSAW